VLGVEEEKDTERPEEAVAERVKGPAEREWSGRGGKVMVWGWRVVPAGRIVKLAVTEGAAL
jgi:hypothetical protein